MFGPCPTSEVTGEVIRVESERGTEKRDCPSSEVVTTVDERDVVDIGRSGLSGGVRVERTESTWSGRLRAGLNAGVGKEKATTDDAIEVRGEVFGV